MTSSCDVFRMRGSREVVEVVLMAWSTNSSTTTCAREAFANKTMDVKTQIVKYFFICYLFFQSKVSSAACLKK
jgi:hypothetical protein